MHAACLVMDFPVQSQAPVAYVMPIANWRYFSLSVDPCWGVGQAAFAAEALKHPMKVNVAIRERHASKRKAYRANSY